MPARGEPTPKPRLRPIRSYVRRAGRMTPSQQKAIAELWPVYGIDSGPGRIDLDAAFGRKAPRVFEIGFGDGEALVEQARSNPGFDYLGIEVHEPGIGHCLLAARKAGVHNLRLMTHDAVEVLASHIPRGSLRRINLYFPDPWPKKRHHKRRIVQTAFIESCANALEPGGTLHIATDWADYAQHIEAVLTGSARFRCREQREHDGDRPLDRPVTKFERRGLRHGHRIHDWCFETAG
jgi:tRNA (guanine-N7-)-methyltransferase